MPPKVKAIDTNVQNVKNVESSDAKETLLQLVKDQGVYSPYFQHMFLIGEITLEVIANLLTSLHLLNQSQYLSDNPTVQTRSNPIILHIHCPGGNVYETISFIRSIQTSSVPVIASIEGKCASAATIIACACKVAVAAPMALYLVHQITTSISDQTVDDNKVNMTRSAMHMKFMTDIYATKTGLREHDIRELMSREVWMSSDTILQKRFVDAILQPANKARELYLKAHPEWDLDATIAERKTSFSRVFVTPDFAHPETGYFKLFDALRAPCGYTAKPLVLEFVGETQNMSAQTSFLYVNMLLLSPVPVYGVFTGSLVNSAVWVFLACHRRLAHKGSTITINPRTLDTEWMYIHATNKDTSTNYKVWQERMTWFFEHMGATKSAQKLLKLEKPSLLTYSQSMDMNLVDTGVV
jgi:ATP-dependent protease ClpP protease subunit